MANHQASAVLVSTASSEALAGAMYSVKSHIKPPTPPELRPKGDDVVVLRPYRR